MKTIYLHKSKKIQLPILSDLDYKTFFGKGWSFINIYSLRELRDVYLVIKNHKDKCKTEVYDIIKNKLERKKNKQWTDRQILDYQNALDILGITDYNKTSKSFDIIGNLFENSSINTKISEMERNEIKPFFLKNFRFKEFFNWFYQKKILIENEDAHKFIEQIQGLDFQDFLQNNTYLYSFSLNNRKSVDSIIYDLKNQSDIFTISDEVHGKTIGNPNAIRFWDVFSVIGKELNSFDSFPMTNTQVYIQNNKSEYKYKNIRYNYLVSEERVFDLEKYLFENKKQNTNLVHIPSLIQDLAINKHYPIDWLRYEIVNQIQYLHKTKFSLQRTSSTFINKKEEKFYPLVNNFYMSHILIRT